MILVFRQAGEECSSLVIAKLEERHAAFLYLPMDLFIMTVPYQFDWKRNIKFSSVTQSDSTLKSYTIQINC